MTPKGTDKRILWLRWLAANAFGELLGLGYLPSTLMILGEGASQSQMSEPPQWIVLLLAAGLGAAAGAVLSFAQWLALRKKVPGAGWWIPANMLAWLAGPTSPGAGVTS